MFLNLKNDMIRALAISVSIGATLLDFLERVQLVSEVEKVIRKYRGEEITVYHPS